MEEIISIPVIVGDDGDEKNLQFVLIDSEWMNIRLDGKEICRLDWDSNLELAIKRMLEMWGTEEDGC